MQLADRTHSTRAQGRAAHVLRVRVEIIGSPKCGIVGKSQPALVITDPMISTRTRTLRESAPAAHLELLLADCAVAVRVHAGQHPCDLVGAQAHAQQPGQRLHLRMSANTHRCLMIRVRVEIMGLTIINQNPLRFPYVSTFWRMISPRTRDVCRVTDAIQTSSQAGRHCPQKQAARTRESPPRDGRSGGTAPASPPHGTPQPPPKTRRQPQDIRPPTPRPCTPTPTGVRVRVKIRGSITIRAD
jgi:hypothetical protein